MTKSEKYQALVAEARADSNVLGLLLLGGRGKGQATEYSDYDAELIVKDIAAASAYKKYEEKDVVDTINPMALEQFRMHATWGGSDAWDRYAYAHNKAVIDKTNGEIQRIIDEKGVVPAGKIRALVEENIGGYMNAVYRALKNFRDGNLLASKLDAAESLPYLLTALFGSEGRLRPYNKFLRWELEQYPIADLPFGAEDFLAKVGQIVTTGDVVAQKELFRTFISYFRAKGFTKTIDSWEEYRFE